MFLLWVGMVAMLTTPGRGDTISGKGNNTFTERGNDNLKE